jgi:hypothetical protein
MTDIVIEQAVANKAGSECRILARSSGFLDDWQGEIERLVSGFGERPQGLACPAAVLAQPFGKEHVAVVHVSDQGSDEAGKPLALGFHFLVIPREAYRNLWGDPFALADRVAPAWHARGSLPAPSWAAEPLPPRTVNQVQEVLKQTKAAALPEDEDIPPDWDQRDLAAPEQAQSPALLGGVQVLVDGGRLVFERPAPDTGLLRGLWTLLPTSTRCQLWPASFAFSNALGFDALVVPPAARAGEKAESTFAGYTTEDQACDYPQGSYELNLQIAAESGDQADLDKLFGRRSWAETWRLGLTLVVVFSVLAVALNFFQAPQPERQPDPKLVATRRTQASIAAGVVGMTNPWNALALLPAARHTWNQIGKDKNERP